MNRRRGCLIVLLVLMAIAGAVAGTVYYLWHGEPAGWKANQRFKVATSAEDRHQIAHNLQNHVLTEFYAVTPSNIPGQIASSTHVIRLSTPQVNAWLDQLLADWAANQDVKLPPELADYTFWCEDDRAVIAFRARIDDRVQVISVGLDIEFETDRKARLKVVSARAGKLPLPVDKLAGFVRQTFATGDGGEYAQMLESILSGMDFEPGGDIDGTRSRWLIGYKAHDEGIDLIFETQGRED